MLWDEVALRLGSYGKGGGVLPRSMSIQVRLTIVFLGLCTLLRTPALAQNPPERSPRFQDRPILAPANVGPGDKIGHLRPTSKKPYKSWSLFLICNPQWLSAERAADLKDLYQTFTHFGDAIGNENLAVWFSRAKPRGQVVLAEPTGSVDLARSSEFCKKWGLEPSHGPFVVVTTTYPGSGVQGGSPTEDLLDSLSFLPQLPKDNAVFELGNMKSADIHNLLAGLTGDLLFARIFRTQKVTPTPVQQDQPRIFVRILESVQRTINSFGCAWHFKVDAGAVQADLQACHKG